MARSRLEEVFAQMLDKMGIVYEREYRFHPVRRWRFDFAIPEEKIAIEIEGGVWTRGRHTRGAGYTADLEKYNTATVMGWRVLRYSSVKDIAMFQEHYKALNGSQNL